MCQVYAGVPNSLYQKSSRSLRMHGQVTSVALENRFWDILEEMAGVENVSVNQFISALHDEVIACNGEAKNFTSLLRVACTTFLMNRVEQVTGEKPAPVVI